MHPEHRRNHNAGQASLKFGAIQREPSFRLPSTIAWPGKSRSLSCLFSLDRRGELLKTTFAFLTPVEPKPSKMTAGTTIVVARKHDWHVLCSIYGLALPDCQSDDGARELDAKVSSVVLKYRRAGRTHK